MAKSNITITTGKRKRAIARAATKPGKGIVRVNSLLISVYEPEFYRMRIQEPLMMAPSFASQVDVEVNVRGGGMSNQADAARLAIAKGLVEFFKDNSLKEMFLNYDRNMLVADVRRKEPAKPNSHGQARAKRQKSYR
jgi:small subunit ribosomal protein S9